MRFKNKYFRRIFIILLIVFFLSNVNSIVNYFASNSDRFYSSYSRQWSTDVDSFIAQEFRLTTSRCSGHFNRYNNKFAVLKNVYIDKSKVSHIGGGELPQTVLNQSEQLEFLEYHIGFLSIPCLDIKKEKLDFLLGNINHLNNYYASLTYFSPQLLPLVPSELIYSTPVLFVTRNEYANFYHSMTDFYITFLICRIFRWSVNEVHVVLTDSHPWSSLDTVWGDLFPRLSRFSQFSIGDRLLISTLVWVPFGYIAPLMQLSWPTAPLLDEFRQFFLSTYGISPTDDRNSTQDICSSVIRVLFIWRRDYLAHPRNPSGQISRKVSNEAQLVTTLKAARSSDQFLMKYNMAISEAQLDRYPMRQQLEMVTGATILVAMHGAALTHTMFMRPGSGLVELFPMYYGEKNVHFRSICRWMRIHYEFYANRNPRMEIDKYLTYFPPTVIVEKVKNIIRKFKCTL